jgi:hypothetical protein
VVTAAPLICVAVNWETRNCCKVHQLCTVQHYTMATIRRYDKGFTEAGHVTHYAKGDNIYIYI